MLGAWLCWALWAQVSLYEVSSEARVELDAATYPIESPLLGRVVKAELHVGQSVRRGDILAEIDAMPDRLQLSQAQIEVQGIAPQLAKLRSQIAAEQSAREQEQQISRLSAEEADDRVHQADIAARFAEGELTRFRKLHSEKQVSDRDLDKAETEAGRLRAAVTTLDVAARRVPQEQVARDRERDVRLERLQGEIATLNAQRETLKAEIERLGYEIERRRVRAPVDGRVGEAASLRIGTVVFEGEKLGSIVPSGLLQVVAQFPAEAAFGRIRTGQTATLRLDGFPWAEYGTVSATVTRVAQEIRDGKVRVELAIDDHSSFRGTLEHGMPGMLEVAVECLSPLSLVLRTSGQWLTVHP